MTEKREGSASWPRLLDIFASRQEKNCTDPRDRIFTLFGISQELDITVPSPDYSDPLSRIYATATVACSTNDSSMEFFYNVPSDSRRAGLPSRAVDWGDPAWPSKATPPVRRLQRSHSGLVDCPLRSWTFFRSDTSY